MNKTAKVVLAAGLCVFLAGPVLAGAPAAGQDGGSSGMTMESGASRKGSGQGMMGSGQGTMMGMPMMGAGMMGMPMMGAGMMGQGMPMMGQGMMGMPMMMTPYAAYAYGPGTMMGLGMMRFGMGPGMIRGLGASGYLGNEAVQEFLDATRDLRKQLHGLMFEYTEVLRQPEVDRQKRIAIENKIQSLRQRIYEKAPRYQFWPY